MPALPNPGMSFTSFDPLPASDLNDIVENIEALHDGSGVLYNNNQELGWKNSSGTEKKLIRLDNDNYLRLSQIPYQANTTNSTKEDQLIQQGWGFAPGTGALNVSDVVTFPVAFDSAPIVIMTIAGYKNGSDPTGPNVSDGEAFGVGTINGISTTGFTANYRQIANNITSNTRILYTWIAIGVKA